TVCATGCAPLHTNARNGTPVRDFAWRLRARPPTGLLPTDRTCAMSSIIAPDSSDTVVGWRVAGRARRLVAFVIDTALFAATSIPGAILRSTGNAAFGNVSSGLLLLALAGVQIWLLAARGQTVGKIPLKVAIVDPATGLPPGYLRAAVIRQGPQTALS